MNWTGILLTVLFLSFLFIYTSDYSYLLVKYSPLVLISLLGILFVTFGLGSVWLFTKYLLIILGFLAIIQLNSFYLYIGTALFFLSAFILNFLNITNATTLLVNLGFFLLFLIILRELLHVKAN